jgi:Putative transposase
MPTKWVVDCRNVGSGEPAFKYLSRYLYRGVIRDHDIVAYDSTSGIVTFRYVDSTTDKSAYRQLPIADFLWRVLQHILPTGMRRVRDYGFLHGNAKGRLRQVQLVLRVIIQARAPTVFDSARMCCPQCRQPMHAIFILARQRRSG